nr:hypothetical protein BaRGS_034101 [Batillaria attramentaria]
MSEDWIPAGYTHTFIIRHPKAAIASYFRIVDHAEWEYFDQAEAGYQEQVELSRLLKKLGHKMVVLDADDLMDRPEAMLRAYCREIGLDFSEKMLDWKPMSDAEFESIFGAWEPAWSPLKSTLSFFYTSNIPLFTKTKHLGSNALLATLKKTGKLEEIRKAVGASGAGTSGQADPAEEVGLDWTHPQEASIQHHSPSPDMEPAREKEERPVSQQLEAGH